MPTIIPCLINILRIHDELAPYALNIAISFCLSFTVIAIIETMLNDATIIIKVSTINIAYFSSSSAEKRL